MASRLCSKAKFTYCLFCFLFLWFLPRESFSRDWQETKGEHFIVYFNGDEKFAKDVLGKAEEYYKNIAAMLDYPRYSEFWTWDKRVKIYIHADRASYISATGQPGWSEGVADYKNKQIVSYEWEKGFLESLLPHEIAHLIFRDFVGFRGQVPIWLDEGVAQWTEERKRNEVKLFVRRLFKNNSLISLKDMMGLNLGGIKDQDKIYIRSVRTKEGERSVLFLSANNLVNIYYIQAVSLVGFLIETYGSGSFTDFCRQLRDGKILDEALKFTYPSHIRSLDELEDQWREYLAGEENG